jgi:hypothetical protein
VALLAARGRGEDDALDKRFDRRPRVARVARDDARGRRAPLASLDDAEELKRRDGARRTDALEERAIPDACGRLHLCHRVRLRTLFLRRAEAARCEME